MTCELCELAVEPVWRNDKLSVILVDDTAYPGFCRVIWNDHVKEMTDLAPSDRLVLTDAVWHVELALRDVMKPDKINVASLGNMTPHLHWHVIPRYADDAHFPNPVWTVAVRATDESTLAERRARLPKLAADIVRRMEKPA
ncbi:HIT family protein [Massilia antarctica]|uniref:HIT family protein n=1 Tax=Massilia antarctica TaxID=2765360 RepID=A0AA49AAP9_9BURK|nr:HIT family protein [Massilia antarctica]QPI51980.1 HIT family protein [Massilia antarctica]